MASLIKLLRRFRSDQSGQSFVIVTLSMTTVIGMAAFGIDVGNWYANHHRDQLVADAAALAAANCLAHPNVATTFGPTCSSPTDTTDATTVAIDYAQANGITISAAQVQFDTTTDTVTVSPSSTQHTLFARLFGIDTTKQTAQAGASWTAGLGSCGTPGTNCDFLFADNSDCTNSTNGIQFASHGNVSVEGNIQSNGNLSGSTSGNVSLGTGTYGPNGTGTCSNSVTYNGHDPWTSPPTQATTDISWPVDYSKDFPACTPAGSPAVAGQLACAPDGYPTFCTLAGVSQTFGNANGDLPVSGNIYCASGPDGNPSDPSTWDGTIQIDDTKNQGNEWYDTFVGGTISYTPNGKDTLSACGYSTSGYLAADCTPSSGIQVPAPVTQNYPLFYATGDSATAIDATSDGNDTINGDMFAPNGGAYLSWGGNKSMVTFIEALNINANLGGDFEGDGPTASGTGTNYTGGSDSLTS